MSAGPDSPLRDLASFPLLEALYGRRSRRFGLGMTIPGGLLAEPGRARRVLESLSPPYVADLHEAAELFDARKFRGTFDPARPGPFRDNATVKAAVERWLAAAPSKRRATAEERR